MGLREAMREDCIRIIGDGRYRGCYRASRCEVLSTFTQVSDVGGRASMRSSTCEIILTKTTVAHETTYQELHWR